MAYNTNGTVGTRMMTKNRNIIFSIFPITDMTNPNVLDMGDASADGPLGFGGSLPSFIMLFNSPFIDDISIPLIPLIPAIPLIPLIPPKPPAAINGATPPDCMGRKLFELKYGTV